MSFRQLEPAGRVGRPESQCGWGLQYGKLAASIFSMKRLRAVYGGGTAFLFSLWVSLGFLFYRVLCVLFTKKGCAAP